MASERKRLNRKTIARSRDLRKRSTIPERLLWGRLRDRRLTGLKFRRQSPLGGFVLDFYCEDHKLALELDGNSHNNRAAYDRSRQAWIEEQGIRVLRFANDDVIKDMETVLKAILIACKVPLNQRPTLCPHPDPLPVDRLQE